MPADRRYPGESKQAFNRRMTHKGRKGAGRKRKLNPFAKAVKK